MENSSKAIENLRKIILNIETGTAADPSDPATVPRRVEFIYGIGTQGLTPFEYELADKKPGDSISIRVPHGSALALFGHLTQQVLRQMDCRNALFMKATLVDVTDADTREVVKAMARQSGCGDGCDCGCGCD